jgi:hypothetical protein
MSTRSMIGIQQKDGKVRLSTATMMATLKGWVKRWQTITKPPTKLRLC